MPPDRSLTMAETHPLHRHLSAVLIADMAGYTAMIEADTDATLTAWREAREQVIRPRIEAADGRLVKFTGDGFLAEFSSVERAIAVAIDIQTELADSPLGFRIGLSVGDVIEQDGDIFGESINVAARLEKLADPGGIAISGSVHEAVRNHIDVRFTDCGTHEVKNVSTPVRVWRWEPQGPVCLSRLDDGALGRCDPAGHPGRAAQAGRRDRPGRRVRRGGAGRAGALTVAAQRRADRYRPGSGRGPALSRHRPLPGQGRPDPRAVEPDLCRHRPDGLVAPVRRRDGVGRLSAGSDPGGQRRVAGDAECL